MRLYADAAALTAYPGGSTVPTESVDSLLRAASRIVDQVLVTRAYLTDTDGMPTDPDDVQAMSDAVCAIVVECAATGALEAGASTDYASVSIGSVSLSGKASSTVTVSGVPIPAAAIIALGTVGRPYVNVGAPAGLRPLDRIAP